MKVFRDIRDMIIIAKVRCWGTFTNSFLVSCGAKVTWADQIF